MPSPFPGMDPYLEGANIWEDFHASLAYEMRAQLTPYLEPHYVAVLTPKVSYEEISIHTEPRTQLIKPDTTIYQRESTLPHTGEAIAIAPAPLIGQAALEVPVKSQSIEIRETGTEVLITAIEILSPVNKRPGHQAFRDYQRKRRDLLRTDVHLMEIDLLRTGKRPPLLTPLPDVPYFIFLNRVENRPQVEIWPLPLQASIPRLPVPLRDPDPDVPLDLNQAIQSSYDKSAYHLRIDYRQPPPKPDLSAEDAAWLKGHLQSLRSVG